MHKGIYTKALAEKVAQSALRDYSLIHVINHAGKKWRVMYHGSLNALGTFNSEEEAVEFARRKLANRKDFKIAVHDRSGYPYKILTE